MSRRKLLILVMLTTACIYFVFNLEFIALVLTTATMLVFASRSESASLQNQIEQLQIQITQLKIDREINVLELISEASPQALEQTDSIDEITMKEIELAFVKDAHLERLTQKLGH